MTDIQTAPIKWAQRSDSLYLTIALSGKLRTTLLTPCHCLILMQFERHQAGIAF
jgi:hypothetical protein